MTQYFRPFNKSNPCRVGRHTLAFFFFAGILCGTYFCFRSDFSLLPLMRVSPSGSVSIVSLYLILFLPFLLSLVSCVLDSVLLFPICYCRAFLFAYIQTGFIFCFCSEGWLLRWLILFSDGMGLTMLYLFWVRVIQKGECGFGTVSLFCAAFLVIGLLDFYIILPYYEAFRFC